MEKYFLGENKERDYTTEELIQIVSDKDRILTLVEVSKILDTIWPVDYKDTFIVPEGEALCFCGGILVNGKNDVPNLKALGEKEKTGKLLLRRSLINRILAGETDCLKEPLTPEAIAKLEKERDLIQEGILRAVGPLLDPDGTVIPPSPKMAVNEELEKINALLKEVEQMPDLVQERILRTVKPFLEQKSTINPETAGNEELEKNNGGISLPPEIDRPEARKAFENALEAGYLEKTSTGYKWKGLPKAAAAYLCEKIYCPDIKDKHHPNWGLLGQFLGLSRLDRAASQNYDTKSERPWKKEIEALLKD